MATYYENPQWVEYYNELNRDERRSILERLIGEGPDDGADSLRRELFNWRYTDPKKPGKSVDKGVWEMIIMPAYIHGLFSRGNKTRKEIRNSLANMRIVDSNLNDSVKEGVIYWELRNVAKVFFAACDSPKYARKLFGIMESSWEEKLTNMARDVWKMADEVPRRFGMAEEMKIFSDAMKDEFFSISKEAKIIYKEVKDKNFDKKLPIVI